MSTTALLRARVTNAARRSSNPSRQSLRGLATPVTGNLLREKDCTSITPPYTQLLKTLEDVRSVLPKGTKLTLAEKLLFAHLRNPEESLGGAKNAADRRGKYLKLRPDRVAMQVRLSASTG